MKIGNQFSFSFMAQLEVSLYPGSTCLYLLAIKDCTSEHHEVCDYAALSNFADALIPKGENTRVFPSETEHEKSLIAKEDFMFATIRDWFDEYSNDNWFSLKDYQRIYRRSQKRSRINFRSRSLESPPPVKKLLRSPLRTSTKSLLRKSINASSSAPAKHTSPLESLAARLEEGYNPKSGIQSTSDTKIAQRVQHPYRTKSQTRSRSIPGIEDNAYVHHQSRAASVEKPQIFLPVSSSEDEINVDMEFSLDLETLMISQFMECTQSSLPFLHITETALQQILNYTNADNLFIIRSSDTGEMLLDASITRDRTWSLLEDVAISSFELAERFSGVEESKWSMKFVYMPYGQLEASKASILCIPVIQQDKYLGCAYFVHRTQERAFDHVKIPLVSLLLTNFFHLLISNASKRQIVKAHKESLSLPCLKDLIHVKQQDTLYFYRENTRTWKKNFVVIADNHLYLFFSPFDSHPRKVISLRHVKEVKVTSQRSKTPRDSAFQIPTLPKRLSSYSLIYIHFTNCDVWLACGRLETAHDWYASLEDGKQAGKLVKIPRNIRINPDEVEVRNIIGKGAAAVVYEGTFQRTKVAIKKLIDQFDKSEVKAFMDEMEILQHLHHPNVVNLFGGYISKDGKPSIVFEFAERGSLSSVLYDPHIEVTNEMKIGFILQTVKALEYLHSFNPPIVHRDLKPANILISGDWSVKLADFGLARKISDDMSTGQGTVKWMAPEVLSNAPFTIKADIYSLGLIMWEILTQTPFFEEYKFNSQIEIQVVNNHVRPPLSHPLSPLFKKLISRCWDPDPNERPTATIVSSILSSLTESDIFVRNKKL